MKIRKHQSGDEDKVELKMTPMIDVVFQLLIFFIFTFKIIPTEGEIGANMTPKESGSAAQPDEIDVTEKIKITLTSTPAGQLADIRLGEVSLGVDPSALTQSLKQTFVGPGGETGDTEVEIDAARELRYFYVIRASNAVMRSGIDKINFTDPRAAGQ